MTGYNFSIADCPALRDAWTVGWQNIVNAGRWTLDAGRRMRHVRGQHFNRTRTNEFHWVTFRLATFQSRTINEHWKWNYVWYGSCVCIFFSASNLFDYKCTSVTIQTQTQTTHDEIITNIWGKKGNDFHITFKIHLSFFFFI